MASPSPCTTSGKRPCSKPLRKASPTADVPHERRSLKSSFARPSARLAASRWRTSCIKKTRLARPSAEEVVAFYHREAKQDPIDLVCRVVGISRSAFYKALSRKRESHQVKPDPDECRLVARIKELVARFPDGSQFGARAFVNEVDRLGIELTYTPYRSPQGNAIVERFFRSLKEECVWH